MEKTELQKMTVVQLKKLAAEQGIQLNSKMRKGDILEQLAGHSPVKEDRNSRVTGKKSESGGQAVHDIDSSAGSGESLKKAPAAAESKTTEEKDSAEAGTGSAREDSKVSEKETGSESGKSLVQAAEDEAGHEAHGLIPSTAFGHTRFKKAESHGKTRYQQSNGNNGKSGGLNSAARENHKQTYQKKKNDRYARIKDDITNTVQVSGKLEIRPEGYGLVANDGAEPPYDHIYVSPSQIQKFRLRTGDILGGKVRPPKQSEKYAAMLFLEIVNGTETRQIINEMAQLMRTDQHESDARFKESHTGILDVNPDGYGFLRTDNYLPGEDDIYVAANQIRRYGLSTGDKITGKIRKSSEGEKNDALLYIEKVNGDIPETTAHRPKFENLLPVFPDDRITLETGPSPLSTRMIDLFSPMGKGQRGMIVAPPKAGKTTLLKDIAKGVTTNHPEIELIILLVDERPEEVTDMRRSIDADIVCSTFDQPAQNHLAAAQMVLERGKRLVEQGKDVVILVDSLTRLTRANNLCVEPSGRTLSGGIDPEALYFPKKFFGSARNIENGGSLTIIATALVETGSRMDDIIYEEFKGTGNMELHLERDLAQRRIYPAINLLKSGTRREDLLLNDQELRGSFAIRKTYDSSAVQMTDKVITAMNKTHSNQEFLNRFIKQKP
ncbi:MAG: transcription termination factor Rho [Bacilli bacterium]|jgi:transcription termination factor Rho